MRVTLDLTPAFHGWGGIGRYARELARALPGTGDGLELRGFVLGRETAAPERSPGPSIPLVSRRQDPRAWRVEVAFRHAAGRPMDTALGLSPGAIFHATDHLLPPLSRAIRTVFTLHDVSFARLPDTHTRLHGAYARAMVPRFLARADLILADSEATRREAIALYGVPEGKIRTVLLGVGDAFSPRPPAEIERVRERLGLPQHYVLAVGTLEPRKNLRTALAAYTALARPGLGLVLVGPRGWHLEQAVGPELARGQGLAGVVMTGAVDEADLAAIYSGASAFLYPSLHEGFGFPPLEALACGLPVLASDVTSLPEVVGDAGVLLPPTDVAAWVEALAAVLDDPARAADLKARGPRRAATFRWDRTARATRDAYEELHARRA